ncbi:unnamed protein product [Candidula unifasciata]|uniref:G-protein coupled receptors family 1 profile domain-containing protein n=1 Tax=Candidula unifasciata TaxID=100452 RepID=A0A8S3ZJM4_9EUPU|nr:unnamed protein product [Candidula unifasciata]
MEAINCITINCTQDNKILYLNILVNNNMRALVIDILFVGVGTLVSLFGIVANMISVVVYVKQGVNDSATVQFLSLSASDCVFSVLAAMSSVSVFFGRVRPYLTPVDPVSFSYCVAITREKAYSTSVIIIFMMSIERCFCVAFPFTVKRIFSKSRSVKAIVCVFSIFVVFLIPEYLTIGLVWTYDNKANSTRLMFWSSRDKAVIDVWKNIILSGMLPVVSGITTTICTAYMISTIRASNTFRHSGITGRHSSVKITEVNNGVKSSLEKPSAQNKDVRLTRTVIAVAAVFIICNIPKCIVISSSVVGLFVPDFSLVITGRYDNLISVLLTITFVFEIINSSSTFLIYYAFSTKFKTSVDHICKGCF